MNSLSKGYCCSPDNCVSPCPPMYITCQSPDVDLHPAPGKALLQCGTTGNPSVPINAGTAFTTPIFVASVDIDTTCLCFPTLKLEFSTLIDLPVGVAAGDDITLQLSRICDNAPTNKIVLKTTTVILACATPTAACNFPYSFIYCNQNVPSRNCSYTLEVINANTTAAVQFRDTAIAAYAVGGQRRC